MQPKQKPQNIMDFIITLGIIAVFNFMFGLSFVIGDSMEPTLYHRDVLVFSRLYPRILSIDYNDIVLAQKPKENIIIIKRVIGLPGDTIVIKDNIVYRNGERLEEPYLKSNMLSKDMKVVVPQGEVFVLGDNRNSSLDSRIIGTIPLKNVKGKILARIWRGWKMF